MAIRSASTLSRIGVLLLGASFIAPADLAHVAWVLTTTEILRVLLDCGIDTYSLREYSRGSDERARLSNTVLSTKILLGAFAGLLVLLLARSQAHELTFVDVTMAYLPMTQSLLTASINLTQSQAMTTRLLAPSIVAYLCVATFAILTALFAKEYYFLSYGVVTLAELSIFLVGTLRDFRTGDSSTPSKSLDLLKKALPIGAVGAIAILYSRTDQIWIRQFMSETTFGLYAYAVRLTDPVFMLVASWILSTIGTYTTAWTAGREHFRIAIRSLLMRSLRAGLITATLSGLGGYIITALIFPAYTSAISAIAILSLAAIPKTINVALYTSLLSASREKKVLLIAVANAITVLTLLAILVPALGLVGASAAILIAECLNTLYQLATLRASIANANIKRDDT